MGNHQPCQTERRGFSAWGRLQPLQCEGRRSETLRVPRKPLTEISGNSDESIDHRSQKGCKLAVKSVIYTYVPNEVASISIMLICMEFT